MQQPWAFRAGVSMGARPHCCASVHTTVVGWVQTGSGALQMKRVKTPTRKAAAWKHVGKDTWEKTRASRVYKAWPLPTAHPSASHPERRCSPSGRETSPSLSLWVHPVMPNGGLVWEEKQPRGHRMILTGAGEPGALEGLSETPLS